MSSRSKHTARVAELIEQNQAFVEATVVRAQCPTSARPGDAAVVLADGTIEGFVGGQCAEGSVRAAAVPLLESGEPLLLRVLPDEIADEDAAAVDGALTVVNPCLSGGAIEVFLEPKLPAARLAIVGSTPIAEALGALAGPLGFSVATGSPVPDVAGCTAVIISSHGRHEHESITAALDAGVNFIGLVASRVRGQAVIDELDLSAEQQARIHSPVGLDIGATTAEEIALSVLAAVVKAVRRDHLKPAPAALRELPQTAIDPVCGMTVVIGNDTAHLHANDEDFWFCNPGCRTRYADELGVAR